MKECGLGTPATRAAIIETLLSASTWCARPRASRPPTGHTPHRSGPSRGEKPGMTAIGKPIWAVSTAARRSSRHSSKASKSTSAKSSPAPSKKTRGQTRASPQNRRPQARDDRVCPRVSTCTRCCTRRSGSRRSGPPGSRVPRGGRRTGRAAGDAHGSGKSLCYQLPGLARGAPPWWSARSSRSWKTRWPSCASAVPPAARIHSGATARIPPTCLDYLNGRLQFLFIAPERCGCPASP